MPYNFFFTSIVVDKRGLYGDSFKSKNAFYKYVCSLAFDNARQYLDRATVVFDGSGSRKFKREFSSYLHQKMNDEAATRIKKVKMQDSKHTNLLQLVDMVCGAIHLSLKSSKDEDWEYRRLIAHRALLVKTWPPA